MDKEALFQPRLPEADVEIPGVCTVRVRALTRGEVFMIQKATDVGDTERRTLATGVVDPVLSQTDVRKWQDTCPAGEIDPVVDKIRELSGLDDDADKSGLPADGSEPNDGVRALPGTEAVDDGGDATGDE